MNKSELIELLKDYKQNIAKLKLRKREKEKKYHYNNSKFYSRSCLWCFFSYKWSLDINVFFEI